VQQSLGETGESSLRTGITGLQSLFGRDYEQQQLQAALLPAQQQYQQNLANQQAQFGGAGNLGSARSALAQQQLAGQAQAQQQQAAAGVLRDISAQRAGVGTTLAQLGQGGLGQALGAAGQGVTAAMTPQQLYNQYASVIFGTPAASYSPDFRGTQGSTVTGSNYGTQMGIGGAYGSQKFGF
jgi:multidrug efflux pump subunit AcrA (membrane-fusion protein)